VDATIGSPGSNRLPVVLFVILSLVTGLSYCVVTPPFQSPDEWNHFYRAWAISEGQVEPVRHDALVGFMLPPEVPALAETLAADVVFEKRRLVEPARIRAAFDAPPAGDRRVFVSTPNSAFLTSLIYFPQSAGIVLGRTLRRSPLECLYLARLMNLIAGTVLIAFAIRREPWRPWLLALVALAPMAAFLRGSASADVVPIGVAFWLTSRIASYALVADATISRREWLLLVAGATLLTPMKLVYAPIALAAWLIPDRAFTSRAEAWRARIAVAAAALAAAVYASLRAASFAVPFRSDVYVDPLLQLELVMIEPLRSVALVFDYFVTHGDRHAAQIVGQLGWLSVNLPKPLIVGYALLIAAVWWLETRAVLAPRRWLFAAFLVASVAAATSLSQYLIWTEVGANAVDGVQGRYLIPLVPLAAWLMPFRAPGSSPPRLLLPSLTVTAVVVATAIALHEIVDRFYPHGFELLL
jgi:uncharacterized membrane protein